jgi:hypothetical protein
MLCLSCILPWPKKTADEIYNKDRQYQTISHVKILNNNIFVTSNVKSSLLVVNSYNIFKGNGNGPLHISHLILKLYLFMQIISLITDKMVLGVARAIL